MSSRLRLRIIVLASGWFVAAAMFSSAMQAADFYYKAPLNDLKFTEGKLLAADSNDWRRVPWATYQCFAPYAVLDDEGEVYVQSTATFAAAQRDPSGDLLVRVSAPRKLSGTLYYPKVDWSGMEKLPFTLDAQASSDFKPAFYEAKQAYYQSLLNRGAAGTAWFRHQVRATRASLGQSLDDANQRAGMNAGIGSLDQTFDLFSGGRAVSENLQLDRALARVGKGDEMVPLADIKGISVAEIDWKPLVKSLQPEFDPLARLVPADQHAVFFPSFQDFVKVADRLAEHGTLAMRLAEPQSTDRRLVARYEQQLGLSIDGLGRLVGPQVVKSVALTGSDPYYLSGTDVAILFEAAQPDLLLALLLAQANTVARKAASETRSGEINGLQYTSSRSDDRKISSYIAKLPGAVVVTNSPYQLERLAAVTQKQAPAIASLDEFAFFRNRYPRNSPEESALVFLSDATIRRWCGARWRIATSRETRDAAVLAELQAAYMDKLAENEVKAGPLHSDLPLVFGDDLTLSPAGVRSSTLGGLDFMTPIAELKFDEATKAEADAYTRWRDGYQQNWRWAFDPIALRLSVNENRLAADLTVMPLIANSEYRQMIAISRGATIRPNAGDRHDALAHLILAVNTKNETLRGAGGMLAQMVPGSKLDPLGWLGESVSLYIDADPFWQELAACKDEAEQQRFALKNMWRIPIGLWAEVSSGFKLTAFLAGLRAFVEQTAPGMTAWEALDYRGQPYVKVTPTERALPAGNNGEPIKAQLYYAASGKFLLLTPSEALLKRALDRQIALDEREKNAAGRTGAADGPSAAKTGDKPPAAQLRDSQPWLGSSVGLQVDYRMLQLAAGAFGGHYQQWMQRESWNNLAILNEWHRLYPKQDPVALHERIWKERLVCPGGGKYVWSDESQSMESTVYGCPAKPRIGPPMPPELLKFRFANFGLTFEDHGLRARVTLDRQSQ